MKRVKNYLFVSWTFLCDTAVVPSVKKNLSTLSMRLRAEGDADVTYLTDSSEYLKSSLVKSNMTRKKLPFFPIWFVHLDEVVIDQHPSPNVVVTRR